MDRRYKYIRVSGWPEYLNKAGNSQIYSQVRKLEENRYWIKEESRRCILCEKGGDTLRHLLKECTKLKSAELSEAEIVSGKANRDSVRWLAEVEKKRREKRASGSNEKKAANGRTVW